MLRQLERERLVRSWTGRSAKGGGRPRRYYELTASGGRRKGTRFEILPELVPLQWDHAVSLSTGGAILRIIDLDGLLRLKLRAGGPVDLMDAAHLILQHPDRIATAREAARAYRLEDKARRVAQRSADQIPGRRRTSRSWRGGP